MNEECIDVSFYNFNSSIDPRPSLELHLVPIGYSDKMLHNNNEVLSLTSSDLELDLGVEKCSDLNHAEWRYERRYYLIYVFIHDLMVVASKDLPPSIHHFCVLKPLDLAV